MPKVTDEYRQARRDEIIEVITHLAFYSGWPTAATALGVAREVLAETMTSTQEGTNYADA